MARPRGDRARRVVTLWATEAEWLAIQAGAERANLSVGAYIPRALMMRAAESPMPVRADDAVIGEYPPDHRPQTETGA